MRPTLSTHRLRRGLPGYLILFAPHAFAHERQYIPKGLPSPSVFLHISTHFTATRGILPLPKVLQRPSMKCNSQVKPGAFTPHLSHRLRALYAQLFRLTLAPSVLPRLLARSQPVLLLQLTSITQSIKLNAFLATERTLQPEGLLHSRGMAASGLPPLRNIPHCCLPQESGPCLSPSVAGHPLRPARDRRLGEPLPHQLPNPTWAHPMACGPKVPHFNLSILRGISYSFPQLSPSISQIPKHYSPVRHSSSKKQASLCYRSTCMC